MNMEQPKHLDRKTPDGSQLTLEALYKIAPSCFTEDLDEDGKLRHVIDFNKLRLLLGDDAVEDIPEAYDFTWVGKRAALKEAAAPISKTLRPCPEESVDWDTTQNLYIEGDNLEVLKLLQNSYMGKVKMIYIDPPYNTGKDFIYHDNFAQNEEEYDEHNYDDEGNRYRKNTDSNGRFHSDWCSMIYARLMVTRSLLTEDGVIFISIDDCELKNLENICNEIFGEANKIATITREAIKGGSKSKNIRKVNDYVLCFARNINSLEFGGIEGDCIELNQEDEYGKYAKGRELNKWGAGSRREDSPSMYYPIPGPNGEDVYPIRNDGSEGRWRLGKEKMFALLHAHNAIFEMRDNGTYIVYEKIRDNSPRIKQFTTLFKDDYINAKGTEEIKSLFNVERAVFDFSKPSQLVKDLTILADAKESFILDFFSGSATTAHAVMQLNAEDGGNRKFIMVQLPEETPEDSEAYKAGYKNICEIGKERIRRAGRKIIAETHDRASQQDIFAQSEPQKLDIGFRVFKCTDSNFKEVALPPSQYDQGQLEAFVDNIKGDRTDLDLLFDCMLRWGVELSLPLAKTTVDGCTIHNVNNGDLVACFDGTVTEAVIDAIAQMQPVRVVFRDSSFTEAAQKMNLFELFKQKCDWTDEEVRNNVRVI